MAQTSIQAYPAPAHQHPAAGHGADQDSEAEGNTRPSVLTFSWFGVARVLHASSSYGDGASPDAKRSLGTTHTVGRPLFWNESEELHVV